MGTLAALHIVGEDVGLTEEGATGARGNAKAGLSKRRWGGTLGLGRGRGRSGADCLWGVEGGEETGVVMTLEEEGVVEKVVLHLETVEGFGGRGG